MSLTKVTYSMISGATFNVADFGAIGDGVTNNVAAFKKIEAALQDNCSVYIPPGEYLVTLTDADVTDTGQGRAYAFIFAQNKKNIKIYGDGKIKVVWAATTPTVVQVFFFAAKQCTGVIWEGITLEGTMTVSSAIPHNGSQSAGGVLVIEGQDAKIINSYFYKVIIPFLLSGYPKVPALTTAVTKRVIVSGNTFEMFEQCTTYGGAASEIIISNNTFINFFTGFKLSSNRDASVTDTNICNYVIDGNVFSYTSDFVFPEVEFDPGKSQSASGIMIQSGSDNVIISNNTIDFRNVSGFVYPPTTEPGCVVTFGRAAPNINTNIKIINNILLATNFFACRTMGINSSSQNVEIVGNNCIGRITVSGASLYGSKNYVISGNTVQSIPTKAPATLQVFSGGDFDSLIIKDNTLLGDAATLTTSYESLIFVSDIVTDELIISGNFLRNGGISTFSAGAIDVTHLSASENSASIIDFETNGLKTASITGNTLLGDVAGSTAIKLTLDGTTKASANVRISGNVCGSLTGADRSRAVELNGGTVYLTGNSFAASPGTAFVFDASVFIKQGYYFGSGAPAQDALYGVTYDDYSLSANATYIKTTVSGSTGWKKIATVP